ncbi:MAG TPA: DUF4340 domain-containing protein [Gammaproteobacteria bacterium]|nr:DUF4340 domain-containing protein [Gammaproteobacteria bacterium]
MNKRTLLNIGLLILVIALVLFAWFKPGLKMPPVEPPLVALQAADIHDIRILQRGANEVKLHRQGDSWQMAVPRQSAADSYLIRSLLNSLASPSISHFKAVSADLGKYGLKDPQLRLWLNETELDFGSSEPLQGHRYVKAGDTIYLTTGTLFYRVNHAAYWWLDKQLLPADAHITAVQLPDATLTLKNGKWQLAPANPAIPADNIQKLVDAWHDARALAVLAPEKDQPRGEVAIRLAGQEKPLRFQILDNPDFLLLVRPDLKLEYRLERNQDDALLHLQTAPQKTAAGHNGTKEPPDARTAGSRDHPPRH